jgi:AcrR family transcriptional regulator
MRTARILMGAPLAVKGERGHTTPAPRRTQAERRAATRRALLDAARELFAEKGFAATGREEIAEAAGVTRGALYHHFSSKGDVFRAVFEELEAETMAKVMVAAVKESDPLESMVQGAMAYLDAALDPAVQRVILIDGPSVLGWEVQKEISDAHGLGLVREALEGLMAAGVIEEQPVEPLAHVLMAALHEAALLVARADRPRRARAEVGQTVRAIISRL